MVRKLCVLIAFLFLIVATASAQDARSALQNAVKAMGATNLKTIQYSGAGWDSSVGQSYNLTSDWPRFEVPSFMRTIDYDAKSLREERTRRQGNYPTYGRLPLQEERVTAMLSGNFAWNMRGDTTAPQTGRFLEGPPDGAANGPVSRRPARRGTSATRNRADATRIPQGGPGGESHGHVGAHCGTLGRRPVVEWKKSDDRLLHSSGEVQSERDHQ